MLFIANAWKQREIFHKDFCSAKHKPFSSGHINNVNSNHAFSNVKFQGRILSLGTQQVWICKRGIYTFYLSTAFLKELWKRLRLVLSFPHFPNLVKILGGGCPFIQN